MIEKHPLCPENHPLVVRNSVYGKFFGCLTYPNHQIIVERPDCPNGHIMVIRTSQYGEFFGCTEYPNCKATYNFEVQDSYYHAKLWKEYKDSSYIKRTVNKYLDNQKSLISEKPVQFNQEKYKKELDAHIQRNSYIVDAKYDKNHPSKDGRLPEDLTEDEEKEYIRLYEAEYSHHILLKKPKHLLKEYLSKSIENRRLLGN